MICICLLGVFLLTSWSPNVSDGESMRADTQINIAKSLKGLVFHVNTGEATVGVRWAPAWGDVSECSRSWPAALLAPH